MTDSMFHEPELPIDSIEGFSFPSCSSYAQASLMLDPAQRLERDALEVRCLEYVLKEGATVDENRVLCLVSISAQDDDYFAQAL